MTPESQFKVNDNCLVFIKHQDQIPERPSNVTVSYKIKLARIAQ
jgi:hypothetical protein